VISYPGNRRVGTALAAVGFALLAVGAVVGLPLGDRHDPLVLVAYLTLLAAGTYFAGRNADIADVWEPVPTERGETVPVPGDGRPGNWRARCRSVLVPAIARREGCSRAAARDRVQRGVWTDDPVAAAALAEDVPPPRKTWFFGFVSSEPDQAEQRERAVAAVAAYVEGQP